MSRLRVRRLRALAASWLACSAAMGDLPPAPAVDLDAEFARATDLLEAGRRAEAEEALASIQKRSDERAWEARAAFVLASDDMRRKEYAAAVRRLRLAPAAAIGLEPYRRLLLGRALDAAGLAGEAAREYRAAYESEEGFASRGAAGRALAAALEKGRDLRGASTVLAGLAAPGSKTDVAAIAAERIRLSIALNDPAAVRKASHDWLFTGASPASAPPAILRAVREEEARLPPAEKGRLGALLVNTGSVEQGVKLLRSSGPAAWPAAERAGNGLALARGELHLKHAAAGERVARAVPRDGSPADYEARLLLVDLKLDKARGKTGRLSPSDPAAALARQALPPLAAPEAPQGVRAGALARWIRLDCEAGQFDAALDRARTLLQVTPGSIAGFEPLWLLGWDLYLAGDFAGARAHFEAIAQVYPDAPTRQRRLTYWRARCLEREGRKDEAAPLYESLAAGDPADVYALFSRKRLPGARPAKPEMLADPSVATATYRRTDELLRLRMFEEAAADARALPSARGRDLRLAEAEFALGRFPAATEAARRAFPELGTTAEARVPDGWRRLYYPIEEKGFLEERAKEVGIEPAILRGLVRQESVFETSARSRAGAQGLTQLMPATAKSLSRSVLGSRYRAGFLYNPGVNARLGAAYLKSLLDRFQGNTLFALAAYNGGPTRMARVIRENDGRDDDEIFESHPAYETRDYVRHVMLYAESYRQLYK